MVIAVISYLSLIIGELVPKHLALRNPEGIACAVAPFMDALSRIASPLVSLLDASTKLVLRLLGQSTEAEGRVTEEEIKTLIAEAETAGVLEKGERQMIGGVLRLGDRAVRTLMTLLTDIDWIDVTADDAEIRERLITTPHSRLPAGEGSPDSEKMAPGYWRALCQPMRWPTRLGS
jgi:magnesium and cobalt exporter, CNNM family